MKSRTEGDCITISTELLGDTNMLAYLRYSVQGKFSTLDPETFLAYYKGTLLGTANSVSDLFDSFGSQPVYGDDLFILRVNTFEEFKNR